MSRARWMTPAVIAVVAVACVLWWPALQHWLAVHTGSVNTPGAPPNYNFWSGFGSDLSEFALVGALAGLLRKHNCHSKGCWRIGRHKVPDTDFICCAKHTPGGAPTHAQIIDAHRAATRSGGSGM